MDPEEGIPDHEDPSLYNKTFPSREALIDYVKGLGRNQGFAVTIRKSSVKDGWVRLGCDRGGNYRRPHYLAKDAPVAHRKVSNLIGCPYEVRGRKPAHCDEWSLEVRNLSHNHQVSKNELGNHSILRRLNAEEMEVVRSLTEAGLKPQDILTHIRERFPKNLSTIKTIYDARKVLRQRATSFKETSTKPNPSSSHPQPILSTSNPTMTGQTWGMATPPMLQSQQEKFQRMCELVNHNWHHISMENKAAIFDALDMCLRGHVNAPPNLMVATERSQTLPMNFLPYFPSTEPLGTRSDQSQESTSETLMLDPHMGQGLGLMNGPRFSH